MLKRLIILSLCLIAIAGQAQQPPTSIILGNIDKPFKGHLETFVKKNGSFRKYGTNSLYAYQKRYAVAVPAGAADTVKIIFIKNEIKSTAFNDTVNITQVVLKENSKVMMPLAFEAKTKKYTSKSSIAPLQSIVPADSVVLLYCSFDKAADVITSVLSSSLMMPDVKATASAQFDKTARTHVIAIAMAKRGIVDLECTQIKTRLYVHPGETVKIHVKGETAENISYELANGSPENNIIKTWFDLSKPVTKYGYFARMFPKTMASPEEFVTEYEKTAGLSKEFISGNQTKNPEFNSLLKSLVSFDLEFSSLVYLARVNKASMSNHYFGSMYAYKTVPEPLKRFTHSNIICDSSIAGLFDFQNFIHLYARLWETMYPVGTMPMVKDPNLNKWELEHMCSKESKAVYMYLELSRYKRVVSNVKDFAAKFEPYKDLLLTKEMKTLYNEVHDTYYDEAALINSPIKQNFLPDSSGNLVDLSTAFKGKVVLFDLWGTSCVPCRAQIPYWNVIADEYKNNPDIVFVAISLERNKPYWINHWKETIRESKFNAIHLLDVEGKDFWKPNKIGNYGYMLLGKDGVWIENRCPKPEYKDKLKKLIDKALADG